MAGGLVLGTDGEYEYEKYFLLFQSEPVTARMVGWGDGPEELAVQIPA